MCLFPLPEFRLASCWSSDVLLSLATQTPGSMRSIDCLVLDSHALRLLCISTACCGERREQMGDRGADMTGEPLYGTLVLLGQCLLTL